MRELELIQNRMGLSLQIRIKPIKYLNMNSSNFTYRESNYPPPPSVHNQTFRTEAPPIRNTTYTTNAQPIVFRSEYPRQVSINTQIPTTQAHYIQQPRYSEASNFPVLPVATQIVQPRIIEETRIVRSRNTANTNLPPQYEDDPRVETVGESQWHGYYSGKNNYPAPPPKVQEEKTKTCCSPLLLGLLGLLALAGLITALVLALKANTGYGSGSSDGRAEGISDNTDIATEQSLYPNSTITIETQVLDRTNATNTGGNSTTGNSTSNTTGGTTINNGTSGNTTTNSSTTTSNSTVNSNTTGGTTINNGTNSSSTTNNTSGSGIEVNPVPVNPISNGTSSQTSNEVAPVQVDPIPVKPVSGGSNSSSSRHLMLRRFEINQ